MLTTNPTVADYDLSSEKNISIINRKSPELNLDFWNAEYTELPEEIYNKYSLDGWVKDIFSEL